MALIDILLHLDSYPEPTPPAGVDRAVEIAQILGGRLTALALVVDFPLRSNRLADVLIGLSDLANQEESRSRQACLAGIERFTEKAKAAGVYEEAILDKVDLYELADEVARRARTRDLCIVPFGERYDGQRQVAETTIFNSGRPVLVMDAETPVHTELGVAVVAWDGSRCAARAMADALPLLAKAKTVRVLTIENDKPAATAALGAEAVRRLKMHGVAAVADAVDAKGQPAGEVIKAYLTRQRAELLVMGAYGHSRMREFVLGGATEAMLQAPPVPILLSH